MITNAFAYSVLAGINLPHSNPVRVSKYTNRMHELNMTGIKYPEKVKNISKFEEQNRQSSVSVFAPTGKKSIIPLRVSKCATHRPHHINILLLRATDGAFNDEDGDEDDDVTHYALIKDLSGFLSHLTKCKRRLYWCENCLEAIKEMKLQLKSEMEQVMGKTNDPIKKQNEQEMYQTWDEYRPLLDKFLEQYQQDCTTSPGLSFHYLLYLR